MPTTASAVGGGGEAAITALNRKVYCTISAATPSEMARIPAFRVAQRIPSGFANMWAGGPVYVRRSPYIFFTATMLAVASALVCAMHVGLVATLVCLVLSFFAYDFYSGMLHVVLDDPANIALPLFGQAALEFQWHHHIPSDIARKDFLDVVGDLNVAVIVVGMVHLLLLLWSPTTTAVLYGSNRFYTAALLMSCKVLMAFVGQFSHRSAHQPPQRPPANQPTGAGGLFLAAVGSPNLDARAQEAPHAAIRPRLLPDWGLQPRNHGDAPPHHQPVRVARRFGRVEPGRHCRARLRDSPSTNSSSLKLYQLTN